MDYKKIQGFIKYFESSKLTTLSIEDGKFKISLSKLQSAPVGETKVSSSLPIVPPQPTSGPLPNVPKSVEDNSVLKSVLSPLVGTYYSASSPTADPFVKVGQKVNKGQPVCIIEAMKIMNEITAPFSGVIEKINVKNGDVLGFNQTIMVIRPQD
jgi:acetyl-CoA carboxylase biotin carboxyl carrier protein